MTSYIRLYLPEQKLEDYASEYALANNVPGVNWMQTSMVRDFRLWFFRKTKFHLVDDVSNPMKIKWFMLVPPEDVAQAKLQWC